MFSYFACDFFVWFAPSSPLLLYRLLLPVTRTHTVPPPLPPALHCAVCRCSALVGAIEVSGEGLLALFFSFSF